LGVSSKGSIDAVEQSRTICILERKSPWRSLSEWVFGCGHHVVQQSSDPAHDRHSAVAHRIKRSQAARFEARRVQQQISGRIEAVCQAFIVADTDHHFRAVRNRVVHEHSLGVSLALSDQRRLDVAIEESRRQPGITSPTAILAATRVRCASR
jgi:hypothetical protein